MLERRVLLAATDAAIAQFHGKLSSGAWTSIQDALITPGTTPLRSDAHFNAAGDVQVDLKIKGKVSSTIASVGSLGAKIMAQDDSTIEAWIASSQLANLSALSSIASIDLPDYARVRTGSVTSAGDSELEADRVRSQFAAYGIDGSGVKVGVISDGVDHRSSVGSDLSNVTVNPSLPGSGDEGTAMLEIVHDLAPGAQLYFSGPTTSVEMVDSINWLVSQGCGVIVDDLGFYNEPFFTDGPVAQAAQNAANSGVVYVSAAGNESTPDGQVGDFHYEHEFVDDGSSMHLHNFNPAGTTKDDYLDFYVQPGGSIDVVLQWSDPFGASDDDYDLRLYSSNHSTILARSEAPQNGSQDPIESLHFDNTSATSSVGVAVRIEKFSGDPRELEMFVLGNAKPIEYATPAGSITGQAAADGAIAVGAVDASDPGTDTVEFYSSQGPRTIYTDFATQTKIERNALTGVAVDGVQTHVGQDGFFENPFFGTSAAAPHVAAIAALIRDADPQLAPAAVKQILMNSAVDLTSYGAGYDSVSGAGRFNALDAVFAAFTPAAAPDMSGSSDSGVSSNDNITSNATPTFTGVAPAGSYVTLFMDGVANSGVQLSSGATNYSITASAIPEGAHTVTVRLASSASAAIDNMSNSSAGLPIVIDKTAPAFTPIGFDLASGRAIEYSVSEDVSATFHGGHLHVRDVDDNDEVESTNEDVEFSPGIGGEVARIVFLDSTQPQLADGNYTATLTTSGITDAAGNAAVAPPAVPFFVLAGDATRDRVVNALDFNALATHYGESSPTFTDGDFNYDGQIDSSDFLLLAMRFNARVAPAPPAGALPADLFSAQQIPGATQSEILL